MRLKIEIIIVIVLLAALATLTTLLRIEHKERVRTETNQTALLTGLTRYKTKDSLNAVKIQTLTLDKGEFKAHEAELLKTIDNQGIKIKRLQSITEVKVEANVEFKTIMKDSLIYIAGKDSLIEMQCLEYKDPYVYFSGCFVEDVFQAQIKIPLKLTHIAHNVPKNIWFFKYGTKSIDLEIISDNPYVDIISAKNIQLKKR